MLAAKRFDPEAIRTEATPAAFEAIKRVIKVMVPSEVYPQILAEYADLVEAVRGGLHDLTDTIAFSKTACNMPPYKWSQTYLASWPNLEKLVVTKLLAISASASGTLCALAINLSFDAQYI
jgi:hypothetical protein